MPKHNYTSLKAEIARLTSREVTIVAVSKGHSWEEAAAIYNQGCRDFGENRVQEALPKLIEAPEDVHWHFIGKLQANKIRKVIGKFVLIHSADTPELVHRISQCSQGANAHTSLLLQVNTSGETTKQGLAPVEWRRYFKSLLDLPGIRIQGLMTIAPLTADRNVIRSCFASLRDFRDELVQMAEGQASLTQLSMGMSHDYPIAIEEGATIIRIGSALFGN